MTQFTVHFTTTAEIAVKVEAEDYDEAIEKADDLLGSPSTLVYASHPRGFDMAGVWEPDSVFDESTRAQVWKDRGAE